MSWFRRTSLASLTAVVAVSLASIASGETSTTAGTSSPSQATRPQVPHKKPAHVKRKKHRRTITTLSPRTTSRLTLAAISHPEGPLLDESLLPAPTSGSCPPEMASIERRFCIDRWEGSLVELGPGLTDGKGDHPFSPFFVVDGHEVRAVSAPGAFPQAYVSGAQAKVACERAGKRLCSPVEWRKACVGPKTLTYGYADKPIRGACNDSGRSPMLSIWGSSALSEPSDWDPLKMNDPRLNQLAGSLARTGSHADCTNEYGVYDMVGNLHEWTSDPQGTFQGGYYLDTSINGEGCGYRTTAHDFDYHDYSTGFRCCADTR